MGTRDPREPETGQMGLAGQPPAFVSPVLWVAQPWSCIWGFIGRKQEVAPKFGKPYENNSNINGEMEAQGENFPWSWGAGGRAGRRTWGCKGSFGSLCPRGV